eukprot:TRINITY_DN13249_c0_g1_i2.p1 TRINITY_DN13249_c0_g1~~TRINITY_DN13249_c0_g1_i2.p1  ORF type:complete len:138 (-),score=46.46 TRINITY_DN13249_c0_g1_i2:157-570(-)
MCIRDRYKSAQVLPMSYDQRSPRREERRRMVIKTKEEQMQEAVKKLSDVERGIKLRTNQILSDMDEGYWNRIQAYFKKTIESDEDLTAKDQEELDRLLKRFEHKPNLIDNIFYIVSKENEAWKLRDEIKKLRFELIE